MIILASSIVWVTVLLAYNSAIVKTMPTSATSEDNNKADLSLAYWNNAMMGEANTNQNHPTMQELKRNHYHWIDIKQLVKLTEESDVEKQLVDLDQNQMKNVHDEDADTGNGIHTDDKDLVMNLNKTQLKGQIVNVISNLLQDMRNGVDDGDKRINTMINGVNDINHEMDNVDNVVIDENDGLGGKESEVNGDVRRINNRDLDVNDIKNIVNNGIGDVSKDVTDDVGRRSDDIDKGVFETEVLMNLIRSEQNILEIATNDGVNAELNVISNEGKESNKKTENNGNLTSDPDLTYDEMKNEEKRANKNGNGQYLNHLKYDDANEREDDMRNREEDADSLLRELIQRFQDFVRFQISFTQILMEGAASQNSVKP